MYETSCQSRFDARYWMLGASALGRPRGMVWGGRREEGSGWGTHVYLWQIHFDIWQNEYNFVKFKNKIKLKQQQQQQCNKLSKLKSLSFVQLFATPWTVAWQALLYMGFSRQGYWSGLPFSSRMDLPDPGIKPRCPALQADSLLSEPPGKPTPVIIFGALGT